MDTMFVVLPATVYGMYKVVKKGYSSEFHVTATELNQKL
jgi:hypothetical protein